LKIREKRENVKKLKNGGNLKTPNKKKYSFPPFPPVFKSISHEREKLVDL
jgi:hypothetical protein